MVMGSASVDARDLSDVGEDRATRREAAGKIEQPRGPTEEAQRPQTARQARELSAEEATKFRRSFLAGT